MKLKAPLTSKISSWQKYVVGDTFVDVEYQAVTIIVGEAYLADSRNIGEAMAVHYPCIQKTSWSTGEAFVRVEELERYLDKNVKISFKDDP